MGAHQAGERGRQYRREPTSGIPAASRTGVVTSMQPRKGSERGNPSLPPAREQPPRTPKPRRPTRLGRPTRAAYPLSRGARPDLTLFCWGREGEAVPAYGQFQKVAVSGASEAAGCAIRTDRTLVCWGGGYLDDAPTGTFRDVATGRYHACAVRSDGSVTCWGYALSRTLPAHTYVQVAVGQSFVCGRRSDSAMFCAGEWDMRWSVPADFEVQDVVTMSAGRTHVCALKLDGSVECWGRDSYGETESPPVGNVFCANTPTPPPAE
jgi:hypothetical protein